MDVVWLVVCGIGALLVRLGMALYACGMVRSKNSAGTMVRHLLDLSLAVLSFWLVGGFIVAGNADVLVNGGGVQRFFLLCTATIASGIVVGVAGERTRFWPLCAASVLLGGVLVPLVGRWVMSDGVNRIGWLARYGFTDSGRGAMIHLTGACCAAVVAVLVGARTGKYNRDGSSNAIPGHSVPLASLGVMTMFLGWFGAVVGFGFNAYVPLNVLLAAASGCVAAAVLSQVRYGKVDVHLTYLGLLGALVAITPATFAYYKAAAVAIGVVAGIVVPVAVLTIDLLWKIDDPTGGIAVHGVGSILGLVAAALLAHADSVGERFKHVGAQLLGILLIMAVAAAAALVVFLLLKKLFGLRAKEADEYDGLDLAEHDIGAYPDFQQTMIKSYHLREA